MRKSMFLHKLVNFIKVVIIDSVNVLGRMLLFVKYVLANFYLMEDIFPRNKKMTKINPLLN